MRDEKFKGGTERERERECEIKLERELGTTARER